MKQNEAATLLQADLDGYTDELRSTYVTSQLLLPAAFAITLSCQVCASALIVREVTATSLE